MTKQQVIALRAKLDTALAAISKEVGYKLSLGSCRFGEVATFKLEAAPINGDGKVASQAEADFCALASIYGLKPEDLGKKFSLQGSIFTVTGLNSRRPRFPVDARRADGKTFKLPADTVEKLLEASNGERT